MTYPTRTFEAGPMAFRIETFDADLTEFVGHVMNGLPPCDTALDVRVFGIERGGDEYVILLDERERHRTRSATEALRLLLYFVDQELEATPSHFVLIHGALVDIEGAATLLLGGTHMGKSSLTALLVADGALYGTDEYVLMDPEDGTVTGVRRPIMLRPFGYSQVADLLPDVPSAVEPFLRGAVRARPVAAHDLGEPMGQRRHLDAVVSLWLDPGGKHDLVARTRTEMLPRLIAQCWNDLDGRAFSAVCANLRGAAHVARARFPTSAIGAETIRGLVSGGGLAVGG